MHRENTPFKICYFSFKDFCQKKIDVITVSLIAAENKGSVVCACVFFIRIKLHHTCTLFIGVPNIQGVLMEMSSALLLGMQDLSIYIT